MVKRIAVVGAGLAGVSTAHELAVRGHQVHVFERRSAIASEASFAPGGLCAAGLSLADDLAGTRIERHWTPAHWAGRWQARRSARKPGSSDRALAMLRMARQGEARLAELVERLQLDIEQRRGALLLLASERVRGAAATSLSALLDWEPGHRMLDGLQARQIEPGLSQAQPLCSAVHLPGAWVVNMRQLAQGLKQAAQQAGAVFETGCEVSALQPGPLMHVVSRSGESGHGGGSSRSEPFDAVVLCAGAGADVLLNRLELTLPWQTVSCFSVTAPLSLGEGSGEAGVGPGAAVVDVEQRVAICHLGQRIRVSGLLSSGVSDATAARARMDILYRVLEQWFPGAARTSRAQQWQATLLTLPDGAPAVGPAGLPGLWLNLGHGRLGAAMVLGAATAIAEGLERGSLSPEASPIGPDRWT